MRLILTRDFDNVRAYQARICRDEIVAQPEVGVTLSLAGHTLCRQQLQYTRSLSGLAEAKPVSLMPTLLGASGTEISLSIYITPAIFMLSQTSLTQTRIVEHPVHLSSSCRHRTQLFKANCSRCSPISTELRALHWTP